MVHKEQIPVLITLTAGGLLLFDFFFKVAGIETIASDALRWNIIIAAFATALGAANLLRIHSRRIGRRANRWTLSVVLLVSMFIYAAVGVAQGPQGFDYQWLWQNLFTPLSATMFSLNAFFIASAAVRAFRVRTAQAAVLMICAFIVMMGNTGVGVGLWDGFPKSSTWVMSVINVAGMRGILIGAALGAMGISLRVILGLERGHLGGVE
jgi:cation transport ATPase